MKDMTDKQFETFLNLVADKFESCENMEEVEKAIEDLRKYAEKKSAK